MKWNVVTPKAKKKGLLMRAYKLIRTLKDGNYYPLFIGKTKPYEFGKWLQAECLPTKGFAVRQGFHCCFQPYAPHLKEVLSNGEKRVWVECEVEDWESYDRPESQGGSWVLAQRMKLIRSLTDREVEKLCEKQRSKSLKN